MQLAQNNICKERNQLHIGQKNELLYWSPGHSKEIDRILRRTVQTHSRK